MKVLKLRQQSTQIERKGKTVQTCSQKQTTNWTSISSAFFLMLPVCFRGRGRRMNLTVLTLLLAMLLCSSCLSELRVKDPDVEEKEEAGFKSSFSTAHTPVPLGHEHLSRSGELDTQPETPQSPLPFLSESSHQPTRRG